MTVSGYSRTLVSWIGQQPGGISENLAYKTCGQLKTTENIRMPPENSHEGLLSIKRHQKNFGLAVDEIKLEKSINSLVSIVQKIERMEPWSKRAIVIRKEINRQHSQLKKIRQNKSVPG